MGVKGTGSGITYNWFSIQTLFLSCVTLSKFFNLIFLSPNTFLCEVEKDSSGELDCEGSGILPALNFI